MFLSTGLHPSGQLLPGDLQSLPLWAYSARHLLTVFFTWICDLKDTTFSLFFFFTSRSHSARKIILASFFRFCCCCCCCCFCLFVLIFLDFYSSKELKKFEMPKFSTKWKFCLPTDTPNKCWDSPSYCQSGLYFFCLNVSFCVNYKLIIIRMYLH